MSQKNVEIVRSMLLSFNEGDVGSALAVCDPSAEWDNTRSGVPGLEHTFTGHAGLLDLLGQIGEAFPDYRVEPEDFLDAGNEVIVMAREIGLGGISGITADREIALVYRVAAGKVVGFTTYTDRQEAKTAAGWQQ